jgi:hypothetical protein
MTTGRAPTLRHVGRAHCVAISWIHERATGSDVHLHDCVSDAMAAGMFAKHFTNMDKLEQACALIGVVSSTYMNKVKQIKPALPALHFAVAPSRSTLPPFAARL